MRSTLSKKLKIVLFIFFGILLLLFSLHFVVSNYLEEKINAELTANPNINYSYTNLKFNLFFGNASLENIEYKEYTDTLNFKEFYISKAEINGFSYLNYLKHDSFKLNNVILDSIYIEVKKTNTDTVQSSSKPKNLIYLNNLVVKNGALKLFKQNKSPDFSIDRFNIKLKSVSNISKENAHSFKNFCFEAATGKLNTTEIKISEFERLYINQTTIQPNDISLQKILLKSIYGQRELTRYLAYEKDHVNLSIPELKFKNWSITNPNDKLLIKVDSSILKNAQLTLFRDKSVPDSKKYKSLYSEKLKKLKLKIDFPSIRIIDSKITYLQLLEDNTKSGKLFFNQVNANLNITNINDQKNQLFIKQMLYLWENHP